MCHLMDRSQLVCFKDRDESSGADGSIKKRRGEESDKHRNGADEKRKSSSDRKRCILEKTIYLYHLDFLLGECIVTLWS